MRRNGESGEISVNESGEISMHGVENVECGGESGEISVNESGECGVWRQECGGA